MTLRDFRARWAQKQAALEDPVPHIQGPALVTFFESVVQPEPARARKRHEMCTCGFKVGERVKMMSALVRSDTGEAAGVVHGQIEAWPEGRCHIVRWKETGLVTGLPNPNVERDLDP